MSTKFYYSLRNVSKSLGEQKVLNNINLDIIEGEILVLIGASGGGKSVLLKHLMGLLKPDNGEILIKGKSINKLKEKKLFKLRSEMGILFQHGALFDGLNIYDNVAFPLIEHEKISSQELDDRVVKALKVVELDKHIHKMPNELSGGMKKRAALARAIVRRPKSLLYDEPTAGLDPIVSNSISKLIKHLNKSFNATSIVITHDMQSTYFMADRIAFLRNGKIDFIGTVEEIKNSKNQDLQDFIKGKSDIEFSKTF